MGIMGRFMDRLSGRVTADEAQKQSSIGMSDARTAVEWIPPKDLDPYQRDLATLMLRTRNQAADLSPAEALQLLGRPYGWETEALVPLPGPARTGWSDTKMFEAISRNMDHLTLKGDAGSDVLEAIDRQVVHRLVQEGESSANLAQRSYAIRLDVTNRVVDFMKDGPRLDERVAAESEMLERQSSDVIRDRFRDTPLLTFEPMPDRGEKRREWMEDMLRVEHAAAREGMMSIDAVVRAASARRGEVSSHWEPAPKIIDRTKDWQQQFAREAIQIEKMSDASLRSRFRDVPGTEAAEIPSVDQSNLRTSWIEMALMARRTRVSAYGDLKGVEKANDGIAIPPSLTPDIVSADRKPSSGVVVQTFAVATMMGR